MAGHLVTQLPEELSRVLAVLWSCLRDMRDDLSSSVGAVMELLGRGKFLDVVAMPHQTRACREVGQVRRSHRNSGKPSRIVRVCPMRP